MLPSACLVFDEQRHDLSYVRYQGDHGAIHDLDAGVALGRMREQRSTTETTAMTASTVEREDDALWNLSAYARAALRPRRLDRFTLHTAVGVDAHQELLSSESAVNSDGMLLPRARGKFLDGSTHGSVAASGFGELRLGSALSATMGMRLSAVRSRVAADPETGAAPFTSSQLVPVTSAGARVRIAGPVSAVVNVDQGFRAPNLYDLTAQSGDAGPGYQLPNPALTAESSLTIEAGLKIEASRVQASGFVHRTRIRDFITREAAICPAALADRCGDSATVFRTTNASRRAARPGGSRAHSPGRGHPGRERGHMDPRRQPARRPYGRAPAQGPAPARHGHGA